MAKKERGGAMADTKLSINEAYNTVMEYMDLLDNQKVDKLELRASQVMWERYNNEHPDDFND